MSDVSLPLPRQYLAHGSVDAGVDYAAPGGTPEYAIGPGVITSHGFPSGFGPDVPVLHVTGGPLSGRDVYYGHSGPSLPVGTQVTAGEQITTVGQGIVGVSTGPHLEIGFLPFNAHGGSAMLAVINNLLGGPTAPQGGAPSTAPPPQKPGGGCWTTLPVIGRVPIPCGLPSSPGQVPGAIGKIPGEIGGAVGGAVQGAAGDAGSAVSGALNAIAAPLRKWADNAALVVFGLVAILMGLYLLARAGSSGGQASPPVVAPQGESSGEGGRAEEGGEAAAPAEGEQVAWSSAAAAV